MKKNLLLPFLLFNFLFLIIVPKVQALTSIPAGNVSGTWAKAGSPYQIQGTIQIPNGQTLSIDPGVIVEFQGHYKLNVQGRLLAVGTAADTIIFTAANTTTGWWGIRFDNTPTTNDTSKIKHCKLQYGKAITSLDNYGGGAISLSGFSKTIISNCFITNCLANGLGGGVFCYKSSPVIVNNTISKNIAEGGMDGGRGGGIHCRDNSNPIISNNNISDNSVTDGFGGGIYCIDSSPTITNNRMYNNYCTSLGGGIYCINGSPKIIQNTISHNVKAGIACSINSTIANNIIANNTDGGIVCISSNPTISNNDIVNNTGGGIVCYSSNPKIINDIISNNAAVLGGALYCKSASNPIFINCILYGNTATTSGPQVYLDDAGSNPNFYYCDVQGGTAAFGLNGNSYTGTYQNNIDADPKFVSPSGGAGTGFNGVTADWSLQASSPCIDKGDPAETYPATDKAGNPRVRICRIDMGAYEYNTGVPLSASITQTQQILCHGSATAALTVNALGGAISDTYSYLWSNGSTSSSVSGLVAGVHSVTVSTTIAQCQVVASYTVSEPAQIIITHSQKDDNTCGGIGDGAASVNVTGGVTPYTYLWSNNNTTTSISGLVQGNYSITVTDKNGCVATDFILVLKSTPILAGNVSGTWTKACSPYKIQGTIQIPNGQTLTIDPGVTVEFQGHYKFNVQGRLLAVGTAADTISFSAADTSIGWWGIRFDNTPTTNDTSKIEYCKLQYGKATFFSSPDDMGGAFYFNNVSKTIIFNSRILNCTASHGGGIFCLNSSPLINNNNISNNSATYSGGAIRCNNSNPDITGNAISGNSGTYAGGGISLYISSPTISNNIISNNSASNGGGLDLEGSNSNPIITNNTISNNLASSAGGGFYCNGGSNTIITNNTIVNNRANKGGALYDSLCSPVIRNCILWGNTATTSGAQVFLRDESSDPNFYYCDIQGGSAAFGLNGNIYIGAYQNNIDADPKFVSPSAGAGTGFNGVTADWSLQSSSPCIDKGDPSGTYPATDKAGNPRVRVCRIDMGAYEYNTGVPLSASITQTMQILCHGAASAALTANAVGGAVSDTYSYSWSNGATSSSVSGLLAGVHSVTVSTTVSQCQVVASYTVSEPAQIIISPSHKNDNACNAIDDGIASVNVSGGVFPYAYLWANNNTSNSISGLAPANYSVAITDKNGCVATNTITIGSLSTTITPNFIVKPDTCIGAVGRINTSPSGGLGKYTFAWSTGSSAQNISGLIAGNYTVTIADSLGCSITSVPTVGIYTKTITTTFTSVSANCHKPNGSITANPSGGTNPYSYVWSNGSSAQTMNNIFAGNYTVNVTDKNRCVGTSSSSVGTSPSIATPAICMVTVDSLSKHNMIVWDKTPFAGTAIKSFIIYRDTANNNYAPIGKTPFDSLSQFIDTVRTLYPANGDPNFSSWRYKIAMEDSCGNISSKSLYHQSLFIQNNSANFNWTDYKIEGQPVPIPSLSNYLFQRDDFSTGNYVTIATLSASSNLSTDPQYSNFQSTANWRVQTQWSISCTPTKAIKTTKSNTIKRAVGGIKENELDRIVKIYPNPSRGRFTVEVNSSRSSVSMQLSIYDMLGQLMYSEAFIEKKKELNLNLPKGIYQLQIETNLGKANKKMIVE
jgi:hypothetical protein